MKLLLSLLLLTSGFPALAARDHWGSCSKKEIGDGCRDTHKTVKHCHPMVGCEYEERKYCACGRAFDKFSEDPATPTGIPLDAKWKQDLYAYAEQNVKHSIWGLAHSERNYHVAIAIAAEERLTVDTDVLFAAAFLHDLGAIEPFRQRGVEHATRSVQLAEPLLRSYGMSEAKIAKVRETVLAHMYDAEVRAQIPEAKAFHDADTLDFLGTIGLVRIVGLTDRHGWAPSLSGGIETLKGWTEELPTQLFTPAAKAMAAERSAQLKGVIDSLDPYTFSGAAL